MARLNQTISVEATDHGNKEGKRTILVEIKVKPELFLLPDMLVNEGALARVESDLKRAAKSVVENHIDAGRLLLRSLAERKNDDQEIKK